jgi:ribosomal protein S27AE
MAHSTQYSRQLFAACNAVSYNVARGSHHSGLDVCARLAWCVTECGSSVRMVQDIQKYACGLCKYLLQCRFYKRIVLTGVSVVLLLQGH